MVYADAGGPHAYDLWSTTRQGNGWSAPRLLTADSPYPFHGEPAISADGRRVRFDCGDQQYAVDHTAICEVATDGTGFRVVLTPAAGPPGSATTGALRHPADAPDGGVVFAADWTGPAIWRRSPGAAVPERVGPAFAGDTAPCVLPDGRVASLWQGRAENGASLRELKIMTPDGLAYVLPVTGEDIADIACAGFSQPGDATPATEPTPAPAGAPAATAPPAPAAPVAPSQPPPPTTGPGGDDTPFPAALGTHYGPDPGGYWIWEPSAGTGAAAPVAAGPFPVVLYLHGCCGNGDWPTPEQVDPWMSHLARRGYVVIAPVYRYGTPLQDSKARLEDALAELKKTGHAGIDLTRFAVIGYSYGGMTAALYAGSALGEGLPVPRALFLTAPCTQNGFCLDPPAAAPALPPGMKAVVIAYADDDIVGVDQPRRVYHELASLPAADRDFVTIASDVHGRPPIIAHHQTTYEEPGAAAWYGIWKLSDALFACTFAGQWCEYALGDTPEQRSMGAWSDGVPVTELDVTDDPGLPA